MEWGPAVPKRTGLAFIICNQWYENEKEYRKGSEVDRHRLTETFTHLGFDVFSFKDLTSTEMLKEANAGSVCQI